MQISIYVGYSWSMKMDEYIIVILKEEAQKTNELLLLRATLQIAVVATKMLPQDNTE